MRKTLLSVITVLLLASGAWAENPFLQPGWLAQPVDTEAMQGLQRIGDEWVETHVSPAFDGHDKLALVGEASKAAWSVELTMPYASYIAPHFSHFDLPKGARLVVRAPDYSRTWTYTGFGKADSLIEDGFWGIHIHGELAIVEIFSDVPLKEGAVVIDMFAHGYPVDDPKYVDLLATPDKAICGSDDSEEAKCYQSSEPNVYNESRAVARLVINGSGGCTGWLIGDQGHLMTNEHCIGSSSAALNTNYEFMAEGASCSTNCAFGGACPGTVVATSATLIQLDAALDYALVQLPTNPTGTYGYMQLRASGASVGERIYIPQHPARWGKRIGLESSHPSDSGFCRVNSTNQPACSGGPGDVGYYCDTQGGSSGSPVLGYSDNLVVALHHCANCQNRGVPIEAVISDLGSNLPNNALPGGGGGGPQAPDCDAGSETFTSGDFTSYSNQNASNSFSVTDGGLQVNLSGNTWIRTTDTYSLASDTVVTFYYRSTDQGEIHALGFDNNDTLNDDPRHFQFWGSQNWTGTGKISAPANYNGSGDWQQMSINVGASYTGTMNLVLTNDNDSGTGNGEFRCIEVSGGGGGGPGGSCTVEEGFESGAAGWANDAGSTCSTGAYVLGNPTQQTSTVVTQPNGSSAGSNSVFTATNTSAGADDVDGGNCILTSPVWNVTSNSTLSVDYFHGQRDAGDDASGDFFRLEYSTDGGSSWNTLASNGDTQSVANWQTASTSISGGSNVQLRVQCSDGSGPGDIVECGIDEVSICDN